MASSITPLENIPLQTVADDGVTLIGEIVHLLPNDLEVEIRSPISGWRTGLHVPYFAMYEAMHLAIWWGDQTQTITSRGRRLAEDLLRTLYAHAQGQGR